MLSHTYHQLKLLGEQIATRKANERKARADEIRTAQHADRYQYERWLSSIDPRNQEEHEEESSESVTIPEGFVIQEDF